MTAVIETDRLAKKYRRVTALNDCTISVPQGRISALVGPNGAGKTTLLRLLAGLAAPTTGEVSILGGPPRQQPAFLSEIGFLAQEIPLYRALSAKDHISLGSHLNPRWDAESVRERLGALNISLDQAVGTLSGGQRSQVALALTLAKRPKLLLLDEPLSALDPLARRTFLGTLAEAAASAELTIVLSSHLIADIEQLCDHLILLASAEVQLCDDIELVLAQHRLLIGPRKDTTAIARTQVIVREDSTERQTSLLVRLKGPVVDPAWVDEEPTLEEIVIGYMSKDNDERSAGINASRMSAIGGGR